MARVAATAADEKQATDIVVLDVSEILAIADAFVIVSANNRRLVRSVAESIEEQIKLFCERVPLRTHGCGDQQRERDAQNGATPTLANHVSPCDAGDQVRHGRAARCNSSHPTTRP